MNSQNTSSCLQTSPVSSPTLTSSSNLMCLHQSIYETASLQITKDFFLITLDFKSKTVVFFSSFYLTSLKDLHTVSHSSFLKPSSLASITTSLFSVSFSLSLFLHYPVTPQCSLWLSPQPNLFSPRGVPWAMSAISMMPTIPGTLLSKCLLK